MQYTLSPVLQCKWEWSLRDHCLSLLHEEQRLWPLFLWMSDCSIAKQRPHNSSKDVEWLAVKCIADKNNLISSVLILLLKNTLCVLSGPGIPKWVSSLWITHHLILFCTTIAHSDYKFSSPTALLPSIVCYPDRKWERTLNFHCFIWNLEGETKQQTIFFIYPRLQFFGSYCGW